LPQGGVGGEVHWKRRLVTGAATGAESNIRGGGGC